jgi:Saccharopine dehydrogenase NADP binding domain
LSPNRSGGLTVGLHGPDRRSQCRTTYAGQHAKELADVVQQKQALSGRVAVYGAYGHTARFVAAELVKRGLRPVLSGRDGGKIEAVAADVGASDFHVAVVDDSESLDRAIDGCTVVVNCAGPFAESAPALIDAAARAEVHYIDVTGEILVALETFEKYKERFRDASHVVLPAFGFFGALGDLAATTLADDWDDVEDVTLAVALDSWQPTRGTRLAGERRAGRRLVFVDGRVQLRTADDPIPTGHWDFPPPFGRQEVVGELTTVDVVTVSRHLAKNRIDAFLNLAPLRDLTNPDTPTPQAADADGRSAQIYCLDVLVCRGEETRRLAVHGKDIYAVTAPIVVEAVERLLDGRHRRNGLGTAGEIFDAGDFLRALQANGSLRVVEPSRS